MLIHFFLIMLAAACLFSTSLRAQDLLQTISGHQTYIHDAAFSPDGHYVLSGDNQGYLRLWNRYGDPEIVLQAHAGPIYAVAFGASGQYLYSAGKDNQLKIWERNGQLQQKLATRAAVQEIYPDADGHVYLASTQVNDLFPCSDISQIIYPGFRFGGGTGDLYMQAPDKCFVLQVLIYMWFKLHILVLCVVDKGIKLDNLLYLH